MTILCVKNSLLKLGHLFCCYSLALIIIDFSLCNHLFNIFYLFLSIYLISYQEILFGPTITVMNMHKCIFAVGLLFFLRLFFSSLPCLYFGWLLLNSHRCCVMPYNVTVWYHIISLITTITFLFSTYLSVYHYG